MKKTLSFAGSAIALITAFFWSMPASAVVVSYDFTARVSSIDEETRETGSWQFGLTSTTMPGSLVTTGDTILGQFFYETETPSSPFYNPAPQDIGSSQIYYGPKIGMSFSSPQSDLNYTTDIPLYLPNSVGVYDRADSYGGATLLHINTFVYSPPRSQGGYITLYDPTGTAFYDSSLPLNLSMDDFQWGNLYYGIIDNEKQLVLNASITSLSLTQAKGTAVPEPTTMALVLIGCVGLVRRQKRN